MGFIWILLTKVKKIYICHWKYIFIFLCLIKLSPGIIYLLHIKMLYFAFCESFLWGYGGDYYMFENCEVTL